MSGTLRGSRGKNILGGGLGPSTAQSPRMESCNRQKILEAAQDAICQYFHWSGPIWDSCEEKEVGVSVQLAVCDSHTPDV